MAQSLNPHDLAIWFVSLLRQRTATNDAEEVRERFREAYSQIETIYRDGTPAEHEEIYEELAEQLVPDLPTWEFSCVANTCGMGVEAGTNADVALPAILDRLPSVFTGAKLLHDQLKEQIGTPHLEMIPEDEWETAAAKSTEAAQLIREYLAISFLSRAAMAMLCRDARLRRFARNQPALVQAVVNAREFNRYAFYLGEVLQCVDGEELVVIDLVRNLGFRVRMHAVRNNCQLFTLLQDALLNHPTAANWDGPKPSPLLASIAKSERMIPSITQEEWDAAGVVGETGIYDTGIWQFYQWPALQPDRALETWEAAAPYQPWWVWGELHPADIVEIDGMRIVLLGQPEMPRTWQMDFFAPVHPALRSGITVEAVLSKESVEAWLKRICTMPREPNPLPPVEAIEST